MRNVAIALVWLYASALLAQAHTAKLRNYGIPPGDYSGITALGGDRYAVVSDNSSKAGFFVWHLVFDLSDGKLFSARDEGFRGCDFPFDRDAEGIAYCPQRGSVFISGEEDQRILEHRPDGTLTGSELAIPSALSRDSIQGNRGFEALCYDSIRHLFWTVTESPLLADADLQLRLTSFGTDLAPHTTVPYTLHPQQATSPGRDHYHGVVALAAEPDGSLLVLEREARIARNYSGSRCWCRLFRFSPQTGQKTLLREWKTRFTLFNTRFANYEGMCLGPVLCDGRRTLLLISDSQGGYGKSIWHLRDRLKVIVLE